MRINFFIGQAPGNTLAMQPTRCLKHPKCTTNHFYCIECNSVFCSDCRNEADDRFNHTKDKFFPIETYLQQRRERIATIKSDVRKYIDKHDRLGNSSPDCSRIKVAFSF